MEAPALNSSESKGAGWRGETLRKRAGDDDLWTEVSGVKMIRIAVIGWIKRWRWAVSGKRGDENKKKKKKKCCKRKSRGLAVG